MEDLHPMNALMAQKLLDNLIGGCKLLESVFKETDCPNYLLLPIQNARESLFYAGCIFSDMLKKCASVPSESQTQTEDAKTN